MTSNHAARQLDCDACRPLLDAFLLDELDPASAEGLRAHLVRCAACSAELGGLTRLIEALALTPVPAPSADLDERILLAAIAERQRRHEHRSWLRDLRIQVFRGAVRTTSTLAVTVIAVALIGATLAFAAGNLLGQASNKGPQSGTVGPYVSPTMTSPTATPSAAAPTGKPRSTVSPTLAPTPTPVVTTPSPRPTPVATPKPSPSPSPTATSTPAPTPTPTPSATETPTDTPTVGPSPTDKPHITPPPSAPSPSASSTTSP